MALERVRGIELEFGKRYGVENAIYCFHALVEKLVIMSPFPSNVSGVEESKE